MFSSTVRPEKSPCLREQTYSHPGYLIRFFPLYFLPPVNDPTIGCRQQSHNRLDGSTFAGTVPADENRHGVSYSLKGDPLKDMVLTNIGMDTFNL